MTTAAGAKAAKETDRLVSTLYPIDRIDSLAGRLNAASIASTAEH